MKLKITILFSLFLIPSYAQPWDEIINDSQYIYGEGVGYTIEEADQVAITNLISKISLVVSSEFSISEDEKVQNGILDSKTYTNSKLQTYSAATLTNTERVVIESSPDEFYIGRYIKRSEIDRIFEGRIRSIKEYVRLGFVAEEKLKIDDALRNYYWAFALLKSVQHPAEITYISNQDGSILHLLTWLPEHINTLLSNISAKIIKHDDSFVDVNFTYDGQDVSSLDFTYFDGRNWSNISSAKDGIGTMEFTKNMIPENIQINYEYAYRSQAHINPEMKAVLSVVKGQAIRKARVNLRLNDIAEDKDELKLAIAATTENALAIDNGLYVNVLDTLLTAIETKNYSSIQNIFTPEGREMFDKLINYGNARILDSENIEIYKYRDDVVVRGIQASFSFKRGVRKNFVEDIVFTFNKDGLIDCVAFGLGKEAKEDIMGKEVWPLQARQTLMEFLENYKTAYALKRLDYLTTIFDEDAVIITGHVAKVMKEITKGDGQKSYTTDTRVSYRNYTKDEYMKHLRLSFASNEFINIRFANNDIRKAYNSEEYGIQIKQDYYSTNYGDEGYLYVQVDITNPDEPIIRVRTWQPKPDPNFGLYSIGSF